MTCQLLSQDEFKRTKDEFFALNAANFMDRCASFTDLSHKHMYLDEIVPTPAFQLSFALIEPSHLLKVAVAIVKTEGGISSKCTTSAFNCTTAKVLIRSAEAPEASRIRGSLPTLQIQERLELPRVSWSASLCNIRDSQAYKGVY
ncbi:hypothetical protein PsorP6_000141 [Peronosclerospora sorghi]|uniref:Uncharacterized protein n=1 Tax=Peronosclerospora sorghi TaxID=230839 RepID=A0ACC0WW39_9STRA|nr:hypothetical protein PsorP6_000141 [Peronosclerospora sorghi]